MGTSNTSYSVGFAECDNTYVVPSISDEDKYIASLLDICRKESITFLISLYDFDIHIISQHLDKFKSYNVIPLIVDFNASKICFDKLETNRFLVDNGFNHPKTYADLSIAIKSIEKKEITFPVIIKPRFGFASKDIFIANTINEMNFLFQYRPDMIIQEFVNGVEYGIDILNDLDGRLVHFCSKRKIEMRSGETDIAEIVDNIKFKNLVTKLTKTLRCIGVLDIDLIISKKNRDEVITILEINPRFGGGYPMSHRAGANFPDLITKIILGEDMDINSLILNTDLIVMKRIEFTDSKNHLSK